MQKKRADRSLIATPAIRDEPGTRSDDPCETRLGVLFHTHRDRLRLVTAHQVTTSAKRTPLLAEGHPITASDEREIIRLLLGHSAEMRRFAIYPEELLHHAPGVVVWWLQSAVRPMHLLTPDGYESIVTRWPTLVLMARERTLCVVALAEDKRPTAETALFHAPCGNVYVTTNVCAGDVTVPKGATIADIPEWNRFWFDSAFTHSNHEDAIAPTKGNKRVDAPKFWHARANVDTPFPVSRLMPLGETLATWINESPEPSGELEE